ncbi:MAG: penicillin-binding transpeptidase domain-containing protein [Candidatus Muiribacteriota bacterium]
MYEIQFIQKDLWVGEASKVYRKNIEIIGRRGSILDRNGNELAASITAYSLYLEPRKIAPELIDDVIDKLSEVIEFDVYKAKENIHRRSKSAFYWFERGLDYNIYRKITAMKLPGVNFKKEFKRIYTEDSLASNVIGMVGVDETDFYDNRGLEGVENYLDEYLKGKKSMVEIMTDNRGYSIFDEQNESEFQKYDGVNVQLTIDKVIQYWAETELNKAVKENKAKKGFIVVMDVNNFELLAVANYPTFSPRSFQTTDASFFKNYAFNDVFEPGSTFKLITVAAALGQGKVDLNTKFTCNGSIKIDNGPEIRCERAHGEITIREAVAVSCNTTMVKIANSISYDEFHQSMENLGFGKKTGVSFPYEEKGLLRSPQRYMSPRDISSMGFGQGLAVTGIQMAAGVSALVNGGVWKTPSIVKMLQKNNEIVSLESQSEEREVLNERNSEIIREIMKAAVDEGTGLRIKLKEYAIGGKTGTAQKAGPTGYEKGKYISSFIGVLPVDNPKILIYVVIDEPGVDNYYGAAVAGPPFRNLAFKIADYMNISPEVITREEHKGEKIIVPNFVGLSKSVLLSRMEMLGLKYKLFSEGDFVVYQEPAPGKIIDKNSQIEIYFGDIKAAENKNIIPDFRGLTMRRALRMLSSLDVKYEFEGNGVVKNQEPAPGSNIDDNTVIRLEFSL